MPTLKAVYGADEVPPQDFEGLYAKNDQGEHVLSEIEGVLLARDHEKLRSTLDHVRSNENAMKRELDQWRGLSDEDGVTPDKIKEQLGRISQLEESLAQATNGGKDAVDAAVRERVAALERDHSAQINAVTAKLTEVTNDRDQLNSRIKDGVFRGLVTGQVKGVVNPGADEDVISRARAAGWKLNEDEMLVAVTPGGNPVYSHVDPSVPMGFKEWLERDLMVNAPYLFKESTGTGDSSRPGRPGSPGLDWTKATAEQKAKAVAESVRAGQDPKNLIKLPQTAG